MNVLVIDDEYLVRESAISHLRQAGVKNVYEAEDGIEGLERIRSLRPDLVIADIRMPGMNGLELLAKLKELNDGTLFVLLTGYDRFEYVQTALHLGAFSYLLKPFSADNFEELLAKTRRKLDRQSREKESRLRMAIQVNQGALWMKRRFAEDLVARKFVSDKEIGSKIRELGIRFDRDAYCVFTISLDAYRELIDQQSPSQVGLIRYGIENIALEILAGHSVSALPFDTEDGQGLLLNYASSAFGQEASPLIRLGVEIKDCIHRYLRHEVTIGISSPTDRLPGLADAYEASKQAVLQRLVKGGNAVYLCESVEPQREKLKAIGFQTEQDMLSAFERCDPDAALAIIRSLYDPFISNEYVDRASLLKLNFQLILLVFKILERLNLDPTEILGEELTLYEEVNQYNQIGAVLLRFGEWLGAGFEAVRRERERGNNKIIEKARSYIHERYGDEISLEMVAEHIPVSPTYLSALFKREYNENFVDYVSNYRVEKAKRLLREGNFKVHEVAARVGIGNVKYFYKVFKKRTGLTPSEYKDL